MRAEKTKVAMEVGLRPIVCVGETLEERERGDTLNVVKRQLNAFASIIADKPGYAAIAYEPVWAIGTGKNAGPAEADVRVHRYPRKQGLALHGGLPVKRSAILPVIRGRGTDCFPARPPPACRGRRALDCGVSRRFMFVVSP